LSTKEWIEKDFYKVLGVPKDASQSDIKKAFRKLAKANHPDSNADNAKAEARFKEVTEANDTLSDPKKRKEYDEARALFGSGGLGGGGFGGASRPGPGGATTFDLGDLFRGTSTAGSGGLGDVFGGIFNRGGSAPTAGRRPRRGSDVESEVSLSFDQALDGVTVPLRLTSDGPCPTCHGTGARAGTVPRICPVCDGAGQVMTNAGGFAIPEPCRECRGRGLVVDDPCPTCKGSGHALSSRTVQARIPAGVKDGQRIRLRGKGAAGENGGDAGDLIVAVRVAPHPVFGRSGDNLTVTVPVTFDEVALGAQIAVPLPTHSSVTLKLAAGTANGRTMRVRGKGVRRKDGTQGDLLVTIDVVVPTTLSSAQREALQSFRDSTEGADPRAALLARAGVPARPAAAKVTPAEPADATEEAVS
jgi:molecular chaperone DnaJ